jgi:hypothetical protein
LHFVIVGLLGCSTRDEEMSRKAGFDERRQIARLRPGTFIDIEPVIPQERRNLADPDEIKQLSGDLAVFNSPANAAAACNGLFLKLGRGQVKSFADGNDVTLSLVATWKIGLTNDASFSNGGKKRFLRLLEDQLGFRLPFQFIERIPADFEYVPLTSVRGNPLQAECTGVQALFQENGVIRVSRGQDELAVQKEWLSDYANILASPAKSLRFNVFFSEFGQRPVYFMMCDESGSSYPLLCINMATAKVVWNAQVWSTGCPGGIGAPPATFPPILVVTDSRIVVFGGGPSIDSYVECFDLKTGTAVFRFATNFWRFHH